MIIGLLGFIGSGKGTAGEILVQEGFYSFSFAGVLKDVTSVMFDWDRSLLEGDTKESREWREVPDEFWSKKFGYEFTPRYALQLMGTEVGRDVFHKDFWIFSLEKQIKKHENVVITDVRFQNEIQFVKEQGGKLLEIRRDTLPHWYDIAARANRGDEKARKHMLDSGIHRSEWEWIGGPIDHVIDNLGTLESFRSRLLDKVGLVV